MRLEGSCKIIKIRSKNYSFLIRFFSKHYFIKLSSEASVRLIRKKERQRYIARGYQLYAHVAQNSEVVIRYSSFILFYFFFNFSMAHCSQIERHKSVNMKTELMIYIITNRVRVPIANRRRRVQKVYYSLHSHNIICMQVY